MNIVITGMGVVSPLGNDLHSFWQALCRGESGIAPITHFDATDFAYQQAGEVHDFTMPVGLTVPPSTDLATRFMLAATAEAVDHAKIATNEEASKTGVVVSTNFGGVLSLEALMEQGEDDGTDIGALLAEYDFLACANHLSECWGWQGPRMALSLSCSSSTAALAHGASLIRAGRARRVIVGGYDTLSRFCWSGLGALRTMTKDALRPFDANRNGTLFSEGAGALVLEDADLALSRGAPILAELAGSALNNNAYHMTAPAKEGEGSARAMATALKDAGCAPAELDHINAHGTGTKYNDLTETQAIKAVLGEHAYNVPITSIKATIGHMMGAAGSVEAIASVQSICTGMIPPTINYETPDPECDLDYVVNQKREIPVSCVLSNSAGIGGCNAVIVLRKWTGSKA